eukprot:5092426-Alexandrium_andersonii.AAC.1
MSASLVGSEMCIRDSRSCGHSGPWHHRAQGDFPPRGREPQHRRRPAVDGPRDRKGRKVEARARRHPEVAHCVGRQAECTRKADVSADLGAGHAWLRDQARGP